MCPDMWLQCSVSFVQCIELLVVHVLPAGLNCTQNSRSTVITDLDTSKRNTERSKHEKPTAVIARETWTVAAADGVRCACVRWEITLLKLHHTFVYTLCIKYHCSQQQNALTAMKFVNVIHCTSVGVSFLCIAWRWQCDVETCRSKVTIVTSSTVCALNWYIKWRETYAVSDWFTSVWEWIVTSRTENAFGKMSRWNLFSTLSKLSLYLLPIRDDGGNNCCRKVWIYPNSLSCITEINSLH
jgi:hypothetical protein